MEYFELLPEACGREISVSSVAGQSAVFLQVGLMVGLHLKLDSAAGSIDSKYN
jgi:hypothetical protein